VLLAGIQSIPQELYDAARADGATPWQRFWSITLPLLKFTMAVIMRASSNLGALLAHPPQQNKA